MDRSASVKKALLRAVLVCWQLVTVKAKNSALQDEIKTLRAESTRAHSSQNYANEEETSIWRMKKAQLVETALDEPQITHQQASKLTVDLLRYLIKEHREQSGTTSAPSGLPPGLSRMSHQELCVQADARGISVVDNRRRNNTKARQQLIIDIREYEMARNEGRIYQEMNNQTTPEEMDQDGFSSEFFTPHVGLSPAPAEPPMGSASGSVTGSVPSWPPHDSRLDAVFAHLPIRR